MNFEELKSEELVACGECKALEELVQKQKVRLFAIPEQKIIFAFAFAKLEGLRIKRGSSLFIDLIFKS
jgi:hypothetical protein